MIQQLVQYEIIKVLRVVRLYLENGTYIGFTKIEQYVLTRNSLELSSMLARQQAGSLRHPQRV